MYILLSHIISHVPTSVVKDILTQPDPEGIREKWIAVLLEYDPEINPTKLIKIQGLAKLMAQYNRDCLSLHMIVELSTEDQNPKGHLQPPVDEHFLPSPWYYDILFMLPNLQAPQHMDKMRSIFLKKKSMRF